MNKYLQIINQNKKLKEEIDLFLKENNLEFIKYKLLDNNFIKITYNSSFQLKFLKNKEKIISFLINKKLKINGL